MATKKKNLSNFEFEVPKITDATIGVVAASWNSVVTDALLKGAVELLEENGVENIITKRVPGAYELTFAAHSMCENLDVDAVIVLGAIVKGETPHFDFISQGVTQGINSVALNHSIPVIFGVLTTDNMEQALERAGGKHGNKGAEAAATALSMIEFNREMEDMFYENEDADMELYSMFEDTLFAEEEKPKTNKKSNKKLN